MSVRELLEEFKELDTEILKEILEKILYIMQLKLKEKLRIEFMN